MPKATYNLTLQCSASAMHFDDHIAVSKPLNSANHDIMKKTRLNTIQSKLPRRLINSTSP